MCEISCFDKTKLSTRVSLNATHLLSYLLMGRQAIKWQPGFANGKTRLSVSIVKQCRL